MKILEPKHNGNFKRWTLASLIIVIGFSNCKKEINKTPDEGISAMVQVTQLQKTTNPYSVRNIEKAKKTLARQHSSAKDLGISPPQETTDLPKYVYFKFNPNEMTAEQLQALENDSTVQLLDFPFANAAIYNEEFAIDEIKKEQLVDGSIYGVTNIENSSSLQLITNSAALQAEFLDTLALIPEDNTTLQFQALREAGVKEAQIARFGLGLCLFKRPSGHVRYYDEKFGKREPVRGMQVWGLVFGIPLHTYTDGNGYYSFPWRFSLGSIMGTHAKNSRVNIKPFNTVGGWLRVSGQLITNFIIGSVHVKGWVGSCAMRNDVDFDFDDHKQNKYWSQLLNAYYFHDQYSVQDGIYNAPQSMVCYAHWADDNDLGSASTPMLHHMTGGQFADAFIQNIFGNPVTGTLLNLIHGLLPDMTFKVCGTKVPIMYNSRLAQTAFHELGHASQFRQVGSAWYLSFEWAELFHVTSQGYGTPGDYDNWGKVQVGESWAEFIGTEYANRRYPTGQKYSVMLGWTGFANALENEDWYFNKWITSGLYHDLRDRINTNLQEDAWDNIGGATIRDMYNVFNSNTFDMCTYQWQFITAYPSYDPIKYYILVNHYTLSCF